MIIYKKQDLLSLLESMRDRMITNTEKTRNLAVNRCNECGLLFQTLKKYQFKQCALCRYEKYDWYRKKILAACERRNEIFDEQLFYANKLRIHRELQAKKDRINQAYNVKTINMPICKRIVEI